MKIVYTYAPISPTAGRNFGIWVAWHVVRSEETVAIVAFLDSEL